jgi:cobalt-zinc-cadmium efflux system outer membrane protein
LSQYHLGHGFLALQPINPQLRVVSQPVWARVYRGIALAGLLAVTARAQKALTWQDIRTQFESANATLQAARIGIDESRAEEITAFLRPNPSVSVLTDGTQLAPYQGVWRPLSGTQVQVGFNYLHERDKKRELRRESAQKATVIAESQLADQQRTLLFSLHNAFVQTLQQQAVLNLTKDSLAYYDRFLAVIRDRFTAGDIARIDMVRLELQRVQYETDVQTARVNLRTAKIQLLMLLNSRTPVDQFEITGPFDFGGDALPLDEFRRIALETRPDLKAALQAVDKAKTDYKLAVSNGSIDPTFGAWVTHNPSFNNPFDNNTVGASVSIPLRIFDKNQGEKLRTQLDITKNERLRNASEVQVYSDVDSAYATLNSNLTLLKPYKSAYLRQAVDVRDTVSFSYQRGGASLLDFLQAQQDYRSIELSYLNLVGAYLTAANQLNLAVGKEVIE